MSDFDDRHYAVRDTASATAPRWYLSGLRTEHPCWSEVPPRHRWLKAGDAVDLLAWAEGKWPRLVGTLEVVELRGEP